MAEPLVSVLIPAFRAARTLGATLESVLAQTWPHVETIVVDDGSPDDTLAVARQYEARGVRTVGQANAGASAARNHALRLSSGNLIQYLDADDLLSPDKIARQVEALASSPTCVALCGVVYFQHGQPPEAGRDEPGYPALTSDDPAQWLLDLWTPGPHGYSASRWGMVQPGAWLTPRAVAEQAGPWNERISVDDDGEYFARVLLASGGIRWVPSGRVYYRQYAEGGSLSSGRQRKQIEGWILSIDSKAAHVLPRTTDANRPQARVALARQYMDVAFHAYPAQADLARTAEARAEALGGHRCEAFDHSRMGRFIANHLSWRAARRLSLARHVLHR